ncbi:hypothetical protein BDZ94DRAFT_1270026 [Collybia nuda]|uniref:Uncharacterized protein n=1 Tax=Collybia nuda TaxID=64659 RepID=A0A9P5XXR2_9AGAR|nr:hypothetical protein BDZ94DRAFT_1270026 [Collybia nuda]
MFKSLTIISLLTTAALAQSSSGTPAPAPSSTTNPYIPSGISKGCTDFLTALDGDKTLTACTSALTTATAGYAPSGNGTTSSSTAQIESSLNTLCSAPTASSCPESLIRGKIADFYSACSVELTSSPNADVVRTYDIIYATLPLKNAICSKDDGGNYCVTQVKLPSGTSKNLVAGSSGQSPLVPDMAAYRKANLAFLFLTPSLEATELCTACTRNVLTSYINFESNVPYAPGLAKSTILDSQSALYTGVQNTCGKNFLSGAVQAAGGLSGGTFPSSGALHNHSGSQGILAAGMSLLAVIISVL